MQIEGMTPFSLGKEAQELPSASQEDKRMKEACKEFESLFLNQLLTSMRKTIPKSKLLAEEGEEGKESNEKEMYDGMMDSEMAKAWASSDGIGLANVLYMQMKQGK